MSGLLLERMRFYQEQAEKAAMEQTLGVVRSALHLQLASLIAKNRVEQIPDLINKNPMDLLSEKPGNYAGEFYNLRPSDVVSGHWHFDLQNRNLIYSVSNSAHFHGEQNYPKQVRFCLKLVRNSEFERSGSGLAANEIGGIDGVILTEVVPYTWF